MRVKIRAVLSAILTFAVFVILPRVLPRLLPPELMAALSQMGFDLFDLLNETAFIGVALALLAAAKGAVEKASPLHPALTAASSAIWLVFSLMILGLGRIETYGVTEFSFEIDGGLNTVLLDMRLFVYIAVVSVGLKIVHSLLEFLDARAATRAPGEEAAAETGGGGPSGINGEPPGV